MKSRDVATFVTLTLLVCVLFSAATVTAGKQTIDLDAHVRALNFSKAVPNQLNYQGYLVNAADSTAVTATLEMTFRLFDSQTKGAELWSETHPAVEVSNGLFQVLLGSVTPFSDGFFDSSDMWLQTEVGLEVLAPRKPLVSTAYSQRTNSAEMLEDNTLTDLDDRWVNEADLDHLDAADGDPADAVYVDDTGKVGIGTTSPLTELDVDGSVNAATYYGDGSNLTGIAGTPDADWTVAGNHMYSAVPGSVGVGTSSPENKLHVAGDVKATTYYGDGSNLTGISGTTDNDWTIDGDDIYHQTGKVGIGTISPSARLDVSGEVNTDSLYKIDGNTVLSTEGTKNISVGIDAGANNTGSGCTFVGDRTGHKNQNSWNTFIGASAGDSNTTGHSNTFVGANAGEKNTEANNNTFVGVGAGYENTTGAENTFVGHWAGQRNTEGIRNTFVGENAGYWVATASYNVYIGWQAGCSNHSGSNNVFIGNSAGGYDEGSNKLIIANGLDTSSVLIYGDFTSGDIGLGTMAPAERLHLNESSGHLGMRIQSDAASYQYLNFGADKGYAFGRDPDNKFFLNAEQPLGTGLLRILTATETGNVGIGTASPTQKLHVVGDIYCTGKLTSDGGNDPPYVLYNKESRAAISERIAVEVPEDKQDGAVLFWNGERKRFEVYLPEDGEFRDLDGNLLSTVGEI